MAGGEIGAGIWRDLRFAARQLRKSPGFAAVAVASLGLGIGANTAIFSLVNALLLRPVPGVAEPQRLVEIGRSRNGSGSDTLSYPDLLDLRTGMGSLSHVFGYSFSALNVRPEQPHSPHLTTQNAAASETRRQFGLLVSANYFDALGVQPVLGRAFRADEDGVAAPPVAIVSHAYWRGRLDGAADAVGRTLQVNGQSVTLVGVLPENFRSHLGVLAPDLFLPMGAQQIALPAHGDQLSRRQTFWVLAGGLLAPGATLASARLELAALAPAIVAQHPDRADSMGLGLFAGGGLPQDARAPLAAFSAALFALVGIILLLASFNVAGLLVARGERRRSELAVRKALGAGRSTIVRQLLVEASLLLVLAAGFAVVLARGVVSLALAMKPATPVPIEFDAPLDLRVLAFTTVVGVVSVLGFALLPAWRAARTDPSSALRSATQTAPGRNRLRNGLVVAQIAGSLVLVFLGGLLMAALGRAGSVPMGFDPTRVVAFDTDVTLAGYDDTRGRLFLERAIERLAALPGVESVAVGSVVPLDFESLGFGPIHVPMPSLPSGAPGTAEPENGFEAAVNIVTRDWFETLRIPVRGRAFDRRDVAGSPRVVVVNETAARRFFPESEALGRTIEIEGDAGRESYEVIGVTPAGKYKWIGESDEAFVYFSSEQKWRGEMHFLVGSVSPETGVLAAAVGREMRALDPNVALSEPRPLEQIARSSALPQRIGASLATALGVIGLGLAALGLYGALAMRVGERRREIGIRLALGARPSEVGRWVAREGARLTALGLALGLGLAIAAGFALRGLLFGVSPLSPGIVLGAALVLSTIALAAALGPIRQALRVDPATSLRSE